MTTATHDAGELLSAKSRGVGVSLSSIAQASRV
jgi:hypothetical protein